MTVNKFDLKFQKIINYSKVGRRLLTMIANIRQTADLADIYPDVSSQLCNRHVKRLSQLKSVFSEVYDDLEPQRYVIVNGVARVVDLGSDLQLNFALQNGIVVSYRRTQKNAELFINGNHLEEQLIFNPKGKHIEGIHEQIDQIKQIIRTIRNNAEKDKQFYGGILYIHSNIGQDLFGYRECFILGVTVCLMLVHEELQQYTRDEILSMVSKLDDKLSNKILSNILSEYEMGKCVVDYGHRSMEIAQPNESYNDLDLHLQDPNSDKSIGTDESNQSIHVSGEIGILKKSSKLTESTNSDNSISSFEQGLEAVKLDQKAILKVDMSQNTKLILCKLDLSREQEEDYSNKMRKIKQISELIQRQKLNKSDIFEEDEWTLLKTTGLADIITQDEVCLVRYCEQHRLLLAKLTNKQIDFAQFLSMKHDLDLNYQIFDEQVVEIITQIHKQANFLQHFCIIEGNTLLISMDRQNYAEIICFLRQLLNNCKLSTYRFLSTRKVLGNENNNSCQIGEIMFTTRPSLGCAIFTPNQDMWL